MAVHEHTHTPTGQDAAIRMGEIRESINALDAQLLDLLNRRAALSLEVGSIKARDATGIIFKPLREREVVDRLKAKSSGPLPATHIENIWREILSSSRALQRPQKVAYLGPEGTFSHFAGMEYLGNAVDFQPCRDLHEIFRLVHERQCELGVVPLENSLQGTVGQSFDLFYRYPVYIQAELFTRVSHALLSSTDALAGITRIYSHPQPLAQCDAWLRANVPGVALIPAESTAAAARRAAGEPGAAAIGHASLSAMLPLRVLANAIEDEPNNWTRFVIIGPVSAHASDWRAPSPMPVSAHVRDGQSKTSLLFTLPDRAGALATVLDSLAVHGINMRKLESRPLRQFGAANARGGIGTDWKYVFFADVECDLEQDIHAPLVQQLKEACVTFRILGGYPTGPQLDRPVPAGVAEGEAPC